MEKIQGTKNKQKIKIIRIEMKNNICDQFQLKGTIEKNKKIH